MFNSPQKVRKTSVFEKKTDVFMVAEGTLEPRPVAVPYIFGGGQRRLENIDRCHSLASFLPPPAAVGSLPSGL